MSFPSTNWLHRRSHNLEKKIDIISITYKDKNIFFRHMNCSWEYAITITLHVYGCFWRITETIINNINKHSQNLLKNKQPSRRPLYKNNNLQKVLSLGYAFVICHYNLIYVENDTNETRSQLQLFSLNKAMSDSFTLTVLVLQIYDPEIRTRQCNHSLAQASYLCLKLGYDSFTFPRVGVTGSWVPYKTIFQVDLKYFTSKKGSKRVSFKFQKACLSSISL
jgi:uncharacterized protein with PQ loop repeat